MTETPRSAPEAFQLPSMPLAGHLAELRNRLIWSILAIAAGGAVGFAYGDPDHRRPSFAHSGQRSADRHRDRCGVLDPPPDRARRRRHLAMPVLLWHVWRFISPGLTPAERRSILPWIPLALVFFALGVSIAFIVLPFAAQFLLSFLTSDIQPLLDIKQYFDFATSLFLAFGILMEFPILLVGLSRSTSSRPSGSDGPGAWSSWASRSSRPSRPRGRPREPVRARHDAVRAVRGHDALHPAHRPLIAGR
jgi:sec-independent protein translocase protein TatC